MRLATHTLRLPGGQRCGVAVGGQGIPLVLTHGFSLAGGLYVQCLSRLASMGFLVVAVDLAGHGGSAQLLSSRYDLDEYRRFLADALDVLGIERAVLVGHSLGGRLMAELAAAEPERAIALVLVDAAVGRAWDEIAAVSRWAPPSLGLMGATLAADTMKTLFTAGDQGSKLRVLMMPQAVSNAVAPWRLVPAALSVIFAPSSRATLARLARNQVRVSVLHGDCDPLVPLASARDAAERTNAEMVVVHGATHSWPLEDPETLRGIFAELLGDGLGSACSAALTGAGVDPDTAGAAVAQMALCHQDALVHTLAPEAGTELRTGADAGYRWTRFPSPPGTNGHRPTKRRLAVADPPPSPLPARP
ncbi:MAG: alpha/beta fold hydrolase [Acidimicrobiia bacterium]